MGLSRSKVEIPIDVQVAHYMPAFFPMIPIVSPRTNIILTESWKKIVSKDVIDSFGSTTSGITVFYNQFYERLAVLDNSGKFEEVLLRYASGVNKIAAKGAILIRIIKYVVAIKEDTPEVQVMLRILGKSHNKKGIRPWQYSIFIQTLLYTIASRLETEATNEIMSAWVHIFAFVMNGMLPDAIKNNVVENEVAINTSSVAVGDMKEV
jgi:hemoglobin-like flavoprotein